MLLNKPVKGFLLDITGVLYNTSNNGGVAIEGSIEAVQRLYKESKVVFISNESSNTRQHLFDKLTKLGFQLNKNDIYTPIPVAIDIMKKNHLRPYLLVHKDCLDDFNDLDTTNPNCVLMGDAENDFTFKKMNEAFKILLNNKNSKLFTMGNGKFYQREDGPCLDVGAFGAALKYSTNCEHEVIGKPNESYFMAAVDKLKLKKEEVVMIGDDIVSDVGGAQKIGIRGLSVRTGKWRPEWENHPDVRPDFIGNNLKEIVDIILDYNHKC
ncbi:Phospholysine phosphohistidine inorganic pyrophosphate phosphatase [Strongyloides ratti]|uniref:Phospholysine phosphohistidine inorganic pyrophosphate phosphatase n=1 Tax=Strongyloides ratti TaxID=34506 RepID=A0A090L739_STRRB|nr:Phospholysine phosphohistidine inorganic pyrophosphate phosphatase [Strongyloides ratti]CEF63943.1 Phospholysine phosphohistidine inorganic pyrophosphate phosphatase [Strongyloides ratti]